ncbi:uncharacterized protein AMSG_11454, partial [Thecamonas trahens ATCC 50062]
AYTKHNSSPTYTYTHTYTHTILPSPMAHRVIDVCRAQGEEESKPTVDDATRTTGMLIAAALTSLRSLDAALNEVERPSFVAAEAANAAGAQLAQYANDADDAEAQAMAGAAEAIAAGGVPVVMALAAALARVAASTPVRTGGRRRLAGSRSGASPMLAQENRMLLAQVETLNNEYKLMAAHADEVERHRDSLEAELRSARERADAAEAAAAVAAADAQAAKAEAHAHATEAGAGAGGHPADDPDSLVHVVDPQLNEASNIARILDCHKAMLAARHATIDGLAEQNRALHEEVDALREALAAAAAGVFPGETSGPGDDDSASLVVWLSDAAASVASAASSAGSALGRMLDDVANRRLLSSNALAERELQQMRTVHLNYGRHVSSMLPRQLELEPVAEGSNEVTAVCSVPAKAMCVAYWVGDASEQRRRSAFASTVVEAIAVVCRYQEARSKRAFGTAYPNDPTNLVCFELNSWLSSLLSVEVYTTEIAEALVARRKYLLALIDAGIFPSPRRSSSMADTLRIVALQLAALSAVLDAEPGLLARI